MALTLPRFVSIFAVLLLSTGSADAEIKRPFTVQDSVEMSYFGTTYESTPQNSSDDGRASPNGKYFIKLTHRGVLPDGELEGTIWLFAADDIERSLTDTEHEPAAPAVVARMSAAINGYTGGFVARGNILLQPLWSSNSEHVYFLGRDGTENRHLFRVSVVSGLLERLSREDQDVLTYRLVDGRAAYLAGPDIHPDSEWLSAGPELENDIVATGEPLMSILYPNFRGYDSTRELALGAWLTSEDGAVPLVLRKSTTPAMISATLGAAVGAISDAGGHELITDSFLEGTNAPLTVKELDERQTSAILLHVEESLNEPPLLVATDARTNVSRVVFDPNPQLASVEMAEVRKMVWAGGNGEDVVGGLVVPSDYEEGQRLPLVIQTHGFRSDRFYRNGYSETANAGRAIASRGIFVLQVQEPQPIAEPRWGELKRDIVDTYTAAIDTLSEQGLIDPNKVGIAGYSETGLFVASSLVEAPDRFAAALVANADPLTTTGYFSYVDSPLHGGVEQLAGASPLDSNLSVWIARSPSASLDTIDAPVLVFAADPWHLLGLWDFYAGLRYLGKPVDLHYIRGGQHNLKKPLHKLSHQVRMVDWFDFWLNKPSQPGLIDANDFDRWKLLKAD